MGGCFLKLMFYRIQGKLLENLGGKKEEKSLCKMHKKRKYLKATNIQ